MWITRHMTDDGRLWGVVMAGECPWCGGLVASEKSRHGHWLNPYNGEAWIAIQSAEALGI